MGKANTIQTSFNSGELAPYLEGRVDFEKYSSGLYQLENMYPEVQGPAVKRPGTRYVTEVLDSSNRTALIPFRFSRSVNYIIEVGNLYMRFYTNHGAIVVSSAAAYNPATAYVIGDYVDYGGVIYYCIQAGTGQQPDISPTYWRAQTAYQIPTVFAQADLFDADNIFQIDFIQSADVMYLTHPSYPPQKLTRLTASTFSIADVDLTNGPFQAQNTTATTIYSSAQTGAGVTLTASANTFTSDMVGSLVYLEEKTVVDVEPWEFSEFYKKTDRVRSDGKTYEALVNGGTEFDEKTVSAITAANPAVVTTSAAHGYENGDIIYMDTGGDMIEVNNIFFKIKYLTSTTFSLTDLAGNDIDSTGYTAYTTGGKCQQHLQSGDNKPVHTVGEITDGKDGVPWTYRDYGAGTAEITAFGSATAVTVTVVDRIPSGAVGVANASTRWALAKWSDEEGYPERVTFFRERLCFAKNQEIDFSVVGDFENFGATDFGDVTAETAFTIRINSGLVNNVQWLSPGDSLLVGTSGAEIAIKEVTTSEVFGPTNNQQSQQSQYGSRPIKPIKINDGTLFLDAPGLKIRNFRFTFESEQYSGQEVSILSEHITESGIIDSAYQQNNDQLLWFLRDDGILASCTYNLEQQVTGFARQKIGGEAVVEAIAVIPTPDGGADELWIIAKRTINSATERYIEYLEQPFSSTADVEDAFFVDSGLTLEYQPVNITNITRSEPPVVTTAAAHGFSNGWTVSITDVTGMDGIQGNYTIQNVTGTTFELAGENSFPLDPYTSGGKARRTVTTISGLDHLEGESVAILADGATQPNETVSSGSITINEPASAMQVGLPYTGILTTMRLEGGGQFGTSQGKRKRVQEIVVRLYRTLGLKYGVLGLVPDTFEFRDFQDNFDSGIPLFTGDIEALPPAISELPCRLTLRSEWPLPLTVIAIMPEFYSQES